MTALFSGVAIAFTISSIDRVIPHMGRELRLGAMATQPFVQIVMVQSLGIAWHLVAGLRGRGVLRLCVELGLCVESFDDLRDGVLRGAL